MTLQLTRVRLQQVDGRRSSGKTTPPRSPLLIVGPLPATATLAANTAAVYNTPDQVVDEIPHGPLAEAACYCLANEDRRVVVIGTPATGTPGAYTSIDVSDFASASKPDIEGDAVVLPEDDLEPGVEFVAGGTLGTTGITYRYRTGGALSSGLSGIIALGTATSITLPYGAGKYNLKAPLALLVARAADVRTKFLAHTDFTTGGVHTIADPNTYTITVPVDEATTLTACGELLTAALDHVDELATVHGAVDATAQTALGALVAPATRAAAVTFIEAFVAIMFGTSGHTQRTTSSIHGAADLTNVLVAPAASLGVITAGDSFSAITSAPRWSIAELGAALDVAMTLPTSKDFSHVEIVGPVLTGVEADSIATKIEALRNRQRNRRASTHFRMRNSGESLSAYATAYETAFGQTVQRRLLGPAVSWYMPSGHPDRLGQVDVRPFSFAVAPRIVRTDEVISPADETGFGAFTGYVRDSTGAAVLSRAVDDEFQELFTPLRAVAPRTITGEPETQIYVGQGGMLAPEGSDYSILPFARVADGVCDSAFPLYRKRLQQKVLPAADGSGTIDPDERKRIDAGVEEPLTARWVRTGQATFIEARLDENAIITGAPPVSVKARLRIGAYGYIDEFDVEVSLA
jgi:hypothetical protein